LFDVGNDVSGVLGAYAKPDQVSRYIGQFASFLSLL
jgi:hypothetical protein